MLKLCSLEKRWLLVGSFLFRRTATVVSMDLCHLQRTPKTTCFRAEIQYWKSPWKLLKLLLQVLQHNPLSCCPSVCSVCWTHSFSEQLVDFVCRSCGLAGNAVFGHILPLFLEDQFYTSQLARPNNCSLTSNIDNITTVKRTFFSMLYNPCLVADLTLTYCS